MTSDDTAVAFMDENDAGCCFKAVKKLFFCKKLG